MIISNKLDTKQFKLFLLCLHLIYILVGGEYGWDAREIASTPFKNLVMSKGSSSGFFASVGLDTDYTILGTGVKQNFFTNEGNRPIRWTGSGDAWRLFGNDGTNNIVVPYTVNAYSTVQFVYGGVASATASSGTTPIIDVTGEEPKEYKGFVPENSVVIPGTRPKVFPSGEFNTPCALIIGKRKESTNQKTSLNDALRTFGVQV